MDECWYTVEVTVNVIESGRAYIERIKFKSLYGAKYMARKYFDCIDVQKVEVINQMTGEVMYYKTTNDEYEAEA